MTKETSGAKTMWFTSLFDATVRRSRLAPLAALLPAIAAAPLIAAPAPSYSIVEIKGSGISSIFDIQAYGMNDHGDVVGMVTTAPSPGVQQLHAFRFDYDTRTVRVLETLGGISSTAVAINNSDTAVGDLSGSGSNEFAATWSADGSAHRPGPFANGTVGTLNDINQRGTITGTAGFSNGAVNAAIIRGNRLIALGTLGGVQSEGRGISDRGHVVGVSKTADTGSGSYTHAFLYFRGEMEDIGTLPNGKGSVAAKVNSRGEVVGTADVGPETTECCDPTPQHAFLYRNGTLRDLGTFSGNDPHVQSKGIDINEHGDVLGWSQIPDPSRPFEVVGHPFLYRKGQMLDVTALIDPDDPLADYAQFTDPAAINDKGWIAVNGRDIRDNIDRVYLLVPKKHESHSGDAP
jgi:probable HAF family extracellular repeat protein